MTSERYGRAPWFEPDDLDEEQRAFRDALLAGPRAAHGLVDERGRLSGPFNARLLNPAIGDAIQRTGAAIRFGDVLSPRERELVILETARAHRSAFEWNSHVREGRSAGLAEAEIAAVRAGEPIPSLDEREALVRRVAQRLLETEDLDDELFAEAEQGLGARRLFTLVSVVGHYAHTALALRVWRVPLREGDPDVFG